MEELVGCEFGEGTGGLGAQELLLVGNAGENASLAAKVILIPKVTYTST